MIQRESHTEYKRNGCGTHGKYIIFVPRKVLNNADIYIFSATLIGFVSRAITEQMKRDGQEK